MKSHLAYLGSAWELQVEPRNPMYKALNRNEKAALTP